MEPTVSIEEIVQDGLDPTNVTVALHISDPDTEEAKQLAYGEYFLNGTLEGTIPLKGSHVATSIIIPRLHPNNYSLIIVVYDRAGANGSATTNFVVTSEPRRLTAEVFINRVSGIERITEGELCLSGDCAPISSSGIARFDSISNSGGVQIHIPENSHSMFLVSLADSRLKKNFVDYTNVDYLANRTPTDSLLVKGENHRRIIFFEKTDTWQRIINDYSFKDCQLYGNYVFRFIHPGDTLRMFVTTASGTVPDSLAAKIWQRGREAVQVANEEYAAIPWDDPHTYILQTGTTNRDAFSLDSGEIVVDPNTTIIAAQAGYDLNQFELRSIGAKLSISYAFGEKGVEHFTKYWILAAMTGIRNHAPPLSGRFTQYPTDMKSLLHPIVEDDRLGMRLHNIFSPGTQFFTSNEMKGLPSSDELYTSPRDYVGRD